MKKKKNNLIIAHIGNVVCTGRLVYRSYRDKTGKMRTFPEAIRPLVPLILLFAISTIWIMYSPNNILDKDPRIIYFAIGTIFSNICVRYTQEIYFHKDL